MHHGRLLMFLGVVILAGCSAGTNDTESVTGQAMYRERIAVPAGARLEVSLEDASTDDASRRLITRIVIAKAGQPPIEFEVPYNPGDIDADHRYEVHARLLDREQLLFETSEPVPVITGGHPREVELLLRQPGASSDSAPAASGAVEQPSVGRLPATYAGVLPCADCPGIEHHLDLREDGTYALRLRYRGQDNGAIDDIGRWIWSPVRQQLTLDGAREAALRFEAMEADTLRLLDSAGRAIESDLDYTLTRSETFDPIEPELRMRGMYRYMADAAMFTECLTGRRLPVVMEADNAELERAYLEAVDEPGRDLLAVITGRIVERVPMDGDAPAPAVVPVEFHAVWPGETCGTPLADADLVGTYWKLTRLGADAVIPIADSREPHLILDADGRVAGSDGCNRLTGSYETDGAGLDFSQLASTMMACPQGMEQADRFRAAVGQGARYRIDGSHLELIGDDGRMLARFEAVYLD